MVCTGFIEPLNLECLIVNMFAGSTVIFTFLSFIFIAGMAAYFRMNNTIALSMLILFAVLMPFYIGLNIYALIIVLVGLLTYYSIKGLVLK